MGNCSSQRRLVINTTPKWARVQCIYIHLTHIARFITSKWRGPTSSTPKLAVELTPRASWARTHFIQQRDTTTCWTHHSTPSRRQRRDSAQVASSLQWLQNQLTYAHHPDMDRRDESAQPATAVTTIITPIARLAVCLFQISSPSSAQLMIAGRIFKNALISKAATLALAAAPRGLSSEKRNDDRSTNRRRWSTINRQSDTINHPIRFPHVDRYSRTSEMTL